MKITHTSLLAPYVPDYSELAKLVEGLRVMKQKIVLTQGTWDMFHTGHIRYLEKAKQAGDVLIVAVDSDRMTKERKGPKRPFDSEEERISVIRSLRSVDIVTFKDNNDDKHDTLRVVRPDVFVVSMSTGPEIQDDLKKFEEYAGEVLNLPQQSSTTTTAKFRRLQSDLLDEFEGDLNDLIKNFKEKLQG
jgi:rfaE bifunctional protein nucleotidyltransferase chain/domain